MEGSCLLKEWEEEGGYRTELGWSDYHFGDSAMILGFEFEDLGVIRTICGQLVRRFN